MMKNFVKWFGIIALAVVIGFTMTACPNADEDDNGNGNGIGSGNGGGGGGGGGGTVAGTPATPQPFNDITAAQLVGNIKIGWNLGNSLDAAHLT